jgi:hypothetical protein
MWAWKSPSSCLSLLSAGIAEVSTTLFVLSFDAPENKQGLSHAGTAGQGTT